ncbi:putative nucleotide-diphospho-sugar transferase [Halobacteria archaeon AArc-dxtr1]|nr:putative nucleotide-diphospho-sugar transferase [Halobacteria archaeon AArc-dxtr1]
MNLTEYPSVMSHGVVYVASGEPFIEAATRSAESVRTHNPELPVALISDEEVDRSAFDQVVKLDRPIQDKGDSILTPEEILFDETLFLDADTYVCRDITDVFEVLDRAEIAMAHNEARAWYHQEFYESKGINVPEAFPEYNSGVIAFRDTKRVRSLFESWQKYYETFGYERNQPALRVALFESDVNLATLPPEYNFMTHTIGFASGDVKILHQGSSDEDLAQWAELLNDVKGKKVTTWERNPCRVVPNTYKSRRYRLGQCDKEKIASLVESAKRKRQKDGTGALLQAACNSVQRFFRGQG